MNMSVIRGYAYEYALARSLEDVSDGIAEISHTDQQIDLSDTRREYYWLLHDESHHDFVDIVSMAENHASLLPVPVGEICFVETTNNHGEVYDIRYTSQGGETVKVSCKTKEVADKSYSISSQRYPLSGLQDMCRKITANIQEDTTYDDLMNLYPHLFADISKYIQDLIINRSEDSADYKMFMRVNDEHLVGSGGYYKTLPDGRIRYYPENTEGTRFYIEDDKATITPGGAVCYTLVMVSGKDDHHLKYSVSLSPGWKTGRKNKVKITKSGVPKGIVLNFAMKVHNAVTFQ